jgi:hypothetical protein
MRTRHQKPAHPEWNHTRDKRTGLTRKTRIEDFDMDFSWKSTDALINQAYDMKGLAKMDRDDTANLIRELAIRLQQAIKELNGNY